ncbi:MAG TPA: ankyrin repeat domain-containing protein [Chryseolinea sp.]|nr:ankyrin repeat domain-containing protein [Chryseolinea sp.]
MEISKEDLKNAICNNDREFLENGLKKYSINCRLEDEDNDTLLMYSLSDGDSDAYQFFIKKQADVTLTNDEGENVIHSIVYSRDAERLSHFLNASNIDHQSNDGTTPLLLAIGTGDDQMSLKLIEKGADVNIGDHEGNTPLHLSSYFGQLDVVKALMAKGANVNVKTKKGNKPLALAVNEEHNDVVRFLFREMYH